MIVRIVLMAMLLAASGRFCVQGWNSYRSGRARLSVCASGSIDRRSRPGVY